MKLPKLVIAAGENCSFMVYDGVLIGAGLKRLEFVSDATKGDVVNTIRLLELGVEGGRMITDERRIEEMLTKFAENSCGIAKKNSEPHVPARDPE